MAWGCGRAVAGKAAEVPAPVSSRGTRRSQAGRPGNAAGPWHGAQHRARPTLGPPWLLGPFLSLFFCLHALSGRWLPTASCLST